MRKYNHCTLVNTGNSKASPVKIFLWCLYAINSDLTIIWLKCGIHWGTKYNKFKQNMEIDLLNHIKSVTLLSIVDVPRMCRG